MRAHSGSGDDVGCDFDDGKGEDAPCRNLMVHGAVGWWDGDTRTSAVRVGVTSRVLSLVLGLVGPSDSLAAKWLLDYKPARHPAGVVGRRLLDALAGDGVKRHVDVVRCVFHPRLRLRWPRL
jgi:hypothetical protein